MAVKREKESVETSMKRAKPSFSHSAVHQFMVTKLPNQQCAISCKNHVPDVIVEGKEMRISNIRAYWLRFKAEPYIPYNPQTLRPESRIY